MSIGTQIIQANSFKWFPQFLRENSTVTAQVHGSYPGSFLLGNADYVLVVSLFWVFCETQLVTPQLPIYIKLYTPVFLFRCSFFNQQRRGSATPQGEPYVLCLMKGKAPQF
jgi:hypothetical protein